MATTAMAERARHLVFVEHLSYVKAGQKIGLSGPGVWKMLHPEGRQRVESLPVATEAEHDLQRDSLTKIYKQAHPRGKK